MSNDPEPPTRRLEPSGAVPPPVPPPGEPVAAGVPDERLVHEELADRIRTLRTWLAVLGTLAAIALGVALWALLTKEEESDAQRGATRNAVQRLDSRVDSLESEIGDRATKSSVDKLEDEQEGIRDDVAEVRKQAENAGDTKEIEQSVETVTEDVQELEQRVEAVEQDGDAGGTETTP
jgi:ABC-type Na+ efflux pump permease subunit